MKRRIVADSRDSSWIQASVPVNLQIALATFGILALELAIIRWASGQIRILAYFNNLVLIAAFLGMGLGVAIGERRPGLFHFTLPALVLLALVFTFSASLGIQHLAFPDRSISLWGADWVPDQSLQFLKSLAIVLGLFWLIATVFLCAGTAVGALFKRIQVLKAYSYDLLGSLLGVLAVAAATWLNTGPHVWLLIGCAPFVFLSRRIVSLAAASAVVLLGWLSVDGAVFSPYNRIDISTYETGARTTYDLAVNRDFHQSMLDLSPEALNEPSLTREEKENKTWLRQAYDIPFSVNPNRGRALIVGAGTGNDVKAALRGGYREIYCVDIDGQIIRLGRKYHPERPYDDTRAVPVVNDARAFFEQYQGPPFDVICYGLLDSHSMFSALSTLRLENYVYTVEGFRAAWRHLSPSGHLSVNFSVFAGDWIRDRMYRTLEEATGRPPVVVAHQAISGNTFLVGKDPAVLDLKQTDVFPRGQVLTDKASVRVTSDNWPFLYIRPGAFPWGYVTLLSLVLATGFLAVRGAFGRSLNRGAIDIPLFLMGAAFLLLETRGVTNLSLLFGSTWYVNTAVFSGILIMAIAANLFVERRRPDRIKLWFIPLLLSVTIIFFFNFGKLNEYPLLIRGIVGGSLNALPIGFAGVIVSMLLARSANPTASLGSNLLGALVGGCLEYLSMWVGLKWLVILVFALYVAALLTFRSVPARKLPVAA